MKNINKMKKLFLTSLIFLSACAGNPLNEIDSSVDQKIIYTSDAINNDHWQSPQETLKRGTGDCEDIAILKLSQLPPQYKGNLVLVHEITTQQYHMIVRATDRKTGETFYLDNLRPEPVPERMFIFYYTHIKTLPEGATTREEMIHGK